MAKIERSGRKKRRDEAAHVSDAIQFTSSITADYTHYSTQPNIDTIIQDAYTILRTIGLAFRPCALRDKLATTLTCAQDRLYFNDAIIDDAIAQAQRPVHLYALDSDRDITMTPNSQHFAVGGMAGQLWDDTIFDYRHATIDDIYDAARLADFLPFIDQVGQMLIPFNLYHQFTKRHVNCAYALRAGTRKNIAVNMLDGDYVDNIYHLMQAMHPFKQGHAHFAMVMQPILSPLAWDSDCSDALEKILQYDIPILPRIMTQIGATAPASLSLGCAQHIAENLAFLTICHIIKPHNKVCLGLWPHMMDLKLGSLTLGASEVAMLGVMAGQVAQQLGVPAYKMAGVSDAKVQDFQAGIEKMRHLQAVAHSGGGLLASSVGTQGAMLGFSLQNMIEDHQMIGAIKRMHHRDAKHDDNHDIQQIQDVVNRKTHFIGERATKDLMNKGFYYPDYTDRSSLSAWRLMNKRSSSLFASEALHNILAGHYPAIPWNDAALRASHTICLSADIMHANARWEKKYH